MLYSATCLPRNPVIDIYTDNYALLSYINWQTSDNDLNSVEKLLYKAISVKEEGNLDYNTSLFLLIARSNPVKGKELAKKLIETRKKSDYGYMLAAEWLATQGETKQLYRLISKKRVHFRYVWALAKGGDFNFAEPFVSDWINGVEPLSFSLIKPFISDNSPFKQALVDKIYIDLSSSDKRVFDNAFLILIENENIRSDKMFEVVENKLLRLLNSQNFNNIKAGLMYVNELSYMIQVTDSIKSRILEIALNSDSADVMKTAFETANHLMLVNTNNYPNNKDSSIEEEHRKLAESIFTLSGQEPKSIVTFLVVKDISTTWKFIANDLKPAEIEKIIEHLSNFKPSNENTSQTKKIKYLLNLNAFKSSAELIKIHSYLHLLNIKGLKAVDYLREQYKDLDKLEQTYISLQFPKLFPWSEIELKLDSDTNSIPLEIAYLVNVINANGGNISFSRKYFSQLNSKTLKTMKNNALEVLN